VVYLGQARNGAPCAIKVLREDIAGDDRFAKEIVVCRAADAPRTETVTVAGHINEAGDLFAEDYPMPPVEEGDVVALLNAGGYLQAIASTHCLRPVAPALFLER